ncbi:IS110 family transposase [Myxococcota bacterium]
MRYLGIDVHVRASVWCLLDASGARVERGKVPTTQGALTALVQRLSAEEELLAGQEVGKLCHFVHDTVTAAGVRILTFNAHHLRMIASSRKKTDQRDAFWIAKALQTGMMPHPVYIPTGEVRELRALLSRRSALVEEHTRWLSRVRCRLQAAGYQTPSRCRSVPRMVQAIMAQPDGIEQELGEALDLCSRMAENAKLELKCLDAQLHERAKRIEAIERLKTIPAVNERVAVEIYATVGDAKRFRNASLLASYAGLVPSVDQSGASRSHGGITKEGSQSLRRMLVQAGHVLLWRCDSEEAAPLRAIAMRIHTARARRKIAVVAAARHILRLAYYVLRDGTQYNPKLLHSASCQPATQAA